MARDNVVINSLVTNDSISEAAGTTINVANGAEIAADGDTDRLLVVVKNTVGSAKDVTFKAGVGATKDLGDLVEEIPATSGVEWFYLESARFAQSDGKIHIDFESAMTGSVQAYRLPKG